MKIVSDWLPELIIAILAPFVVSLIRKAYSFIKEMLTGRESTPMRPNKPPKENQLGDCKAAQYINRRNLLIFQAKQDAKKRLSMLFVNSVSSFCFLAVFCLFSYGLYGFLPSVQNIDSSEFILPFYIAYCFFCFICWFIYIAGLIALMFLVSLSCLLLINNVPSWPDLKKKFRERKYFKQSMKEGYYIPISKVVDIASHFNTYLLLAADSREAFSKDKVIGAKRIDAPIYNMIRPHLSEEPAVFIYSRHGEASYKPTKKARDKYKYVYDLGPVCAAMKDLEIVAHQLHYLQDGKCLKLP